MLHYFLQIATALLTAASIVLLLAASATDLAFRQVPNTISAMLMLCGLTLRAVSGSLPGGLIAAAAVFVLAAFCWRRGWLGGGDVKLLAAATLTLPPLFAPQFLLAVALAGGALAIIYVALSVPLRSATSRRGSESSAVPAAGSHQYGGAVRLFRRLLSIEKRRIRQRSSLPYAAAIAAGAFFVLIRQ